MKELEEDNLRDSANLNRSSYTPVSVNEGEGIDGGLRESGLLDTSSTDVQVGYFTKLVETRRSQLEQSEASADGLKTSSNQGTDRLYLVQKMRHLYQASRR